MAPLYDFAVVQTLIVNEIERRGRGAQTRLAEAVGVRVQTVNKWTKRQTSPEADKWPAIESHFGWPPGYIRQQAATAFEILDRLAYDDEDMRLLQVVVELRRRGMTPEEVLEAAQGGTTESQTGTVDKPPATSGFDPDEG